MYQLAPFPWVSMKHSGIIKCLGAQKLHRSRREDGLVPDPSGGSDK